MCVKVNLCPLGCGQAQDSLYRCGCSRLTRGYQTAVTHRPQPPVLCLAASPFTLVWALVSCPLHFKMMLSICHLGGDLILTLAVTHECKNTVPFTW